MAGPPQRWDTLLIVGLAGAAGLGLGSVLSWRGFVGLAVVAGVALTGALVAWVVVLPGRLARLSRAGTGADHRHQGRLASAFHAGVGRMLPDWARSPL